MLLSATWSLVQKTFSTWRLSIGEKWKYGCMTKASGVVFCMLLHLLGTLMHSAAFSMSVCHKPLQLGADVWPLM